MDDDYLTEDEVAKFLRRKVSTLRKGRYTEDDHPTYVKVGALILYPRKEFFQWLEKHTVRAGA